MPWLLFDRASGLGGRGWCCSMALLVLARENGVTPARLAISTSPICQCMASAARQGMAISSAIRDHMSALNLRKRQQCRTNRSGRRVQRFTPAAIDVPLVQPGELIFTIFIPLTPSLEIILVVKTTADCTTAWEMFADIFPFHTLTPKVNDSSILLWRPL